MIITKEQSDNLKAILDHMAYKVLQDPYYNINDAYEKIIKMFALMRPEDSDKK